MSPIDRLTDKSEVLTYHASTVTEPAHGSIVMTQGLYGTAWQRHASDGLWHSSTGLVRTWVELFRKNTGATGVKLILDLTPKVVATEPGNRIRVTGYIMATEPVGVDMDDHVDTLKPLVEGLLRSVGLVDVKCLDLDVEDANSEDD